MNRKILTLGLLFSAAALNAFADELKVDISSFVYAGSRTRAAELCGKVTGPINSMLTVRVVVDDKTDRPGVYNVLVGKDGKFCTTVVTYTGTAAASVLNPVTAEVMSSTQSAISSKELSR